MSNENRRRPRVSHPFMVRYRPDTGMPKNRGWFVSPLRDLSSGGARFFSEQAVEPGVLLQTQLLLPTAAQPVEVKARVAWARPVRFGMTELGVTFDPADVGSQERIDAAVEHFLREDKRERR